jgi:hypothetical protein
MADLVATTLTTLPPEEVLVRAVQFFSTENWRAQSQSNRVATFVGTPKIPWVKILIAILLMFCFVLPGLLYYIYAIRKVYRFQNIVVTTSPKAAGSEVVVTYAPHAKNLVANFLDALPRA